MDRDGRLVLLVDVFDVGALGLLVGLEARLVVTLALFQLAENGASHVEAELTLVGVARAHGELGRLAGLLHLPELHQRPRALRIEIRRIEHVVVSDDLELILELLHLLRGRLDVEEELPVELPRRLLRSRVHAVGVLVDLARAAEVIHRRGQVSLRFAHHASEHVVADDRFRLVAQQRVHLAPRGHELVLLEELEDLVLLLGLRDATGGCIGARDGAPHRHHADDDEQDLQQEGPSAHPVLHGPSMLAETSFSSSSLQHS